MIIAIKSGIWISLKEYTIPKLKQYSQNDKMNIFIPKWKFCLASKKLAMADLGFEMPFLKRCEKIKTWLSFLRSLQWVYFWF